MLFKAAVLPAGEEFGKAQKGIDGEPGAGEPLGGGGGPGGARRAHPEHQYKKKIQPDVEHRSCPQKEERGHGVAHCPQQRSEKVVQKSAADAPEHRPQVLPHDGGHCLRHREQEEDGIQKAEHRQVEHQGEGKDHQKGDIDAAPQAGKLPAAVAQGKDGAAAIL